MPINFPALTALYNPDLFLQGQDSLKLKEKQEKKESLSDVTILLSGDYFFIKPTFLKKSEEAYKKIDSQISYRDINDGTILYEHNGKTYIIYIELKSGYKGVCSKAIYQIPTSSIKIKSYLKNLKDFNSEYYIEIGIIVSFPPKREDKFDASNNGMVLANKVSYINIQNNTEDKFDKGFRTKGKVTMLASDFPTLDQSMLIDSIKFKSLDVYHHIVKGNNEQIDLAQYLY